MKPEKLERTSVDGSKLNLEALYQIAPSCFTEEKDEKTGAVKHVVNFKTLRQLLGDDAVEDGEEMYQFTWPGKQAARREAAAPITDTLRPVPEDSVDWDSTQNLYIEGDNLRVLKLLQKGYMGKVKMIYIDPPYNTGNDFVYHDDFAHTTEEEELAAGNVDEEGNRFRKNLDSNGRFHSDWCSMIYSRLLVARSLLTEDGVIFISIDDNEDENLRKICSEVFGVGNFIAQVVWERAYSPINLMKHFSPSHDYILVYAKNLDSAICNGIQRSQEANDRYSNPDNDPRGVWKASDLSVGPAVAENIYTITTPSGREVEPPAGRSWSLSRNAFRERLADNRIWFGENGNNVPAMKRFLSELRKTGVTPMTIWKHTEVDHSQGATQKLAAMFDGKKYFDYPKPVTLIQRCLQLYSSNDDLVLDFFSGSATTAHAVMQLNAEDEGNRKYICVQLPEETPEDSEARKAGYTTIPEIAKERIRRAGKKIKDESPLTTKDLDTGFRVFRLADSNYENVEKSPNEYDQQMLDLFADNIKTDRTDLDLLFGAMLSWGVQLSLPMQTEEVDGCKIYTVDGNGLVACFAEDITENVVKAMADKQPLRVLFRDSCFAEDKTKINIFELFKQQLDWDESESMQNIRVI
ncbi:site-specific DNA-methyltransferase [Bacteroides pyogenes]|uniref:site-specific DNA-methyltransferase n=1 Tax=Bacteroides pyogenes TaxID=310300 RepID=UPI0024312DB3|nr:site-specific DNA-methyltransferase [Bacteroides pyogenes]MCI7071621.1 site-specific DNA-methyltransferase [Bacteroides pyogenes]